MMAWWLKTVALVPLLLWMAAKISKAVMAVIFAQFTGIVAWFLSLAFVLALVWIWFKLCIAVGCGILLRYTGIKLEVS